MKRSVIRLCSAVLLMLIALSASAATIGAISSQDKPVKKDTYVWIKLLFATEPRAEEILLFSADGIPIQRLVTDENGSAVSELLIPGKYYAFTAQGCTEFTLHENASVTADGGCGWSDGEILHLTSAEVGTVTVERAAKTELLTQNGGFLDYTLKNDTFERRQVVRCTASGGILTCTFEGVPYGTYVLVENGTSRCRVTVSADQNSVTVTLP
ncbi:MAG: hypothetical protein PUF80_03600 [Firmicutes bacterium]|nr:hypothetical protein [Bacillota bacterium]